MRKWRIFVKGITVTVILLLLFFLVRWLFFNVVQKNNIIDGMVNLRLAVIEAMEAGEESSVFFVKNVDRADVHSINVYVDSAYGNVESYRIFIESGDYLAIQFNYILSDNYYVIRKYLYQEEIPNDKTKAIEIYNMVESFMKQNINDMMTDFDKELAVHDYIISNCSYGYPNDEADAYTAYGALVSQKAVCDGYAEAFFLMLSCMGIDSDIVVGYAGNELHAWNQIKLDGNWYNVDLTWDDSLPDMGSRVKHTYFNIDDDVLRLTHSWQEQYYNSCTATYYNFYQRKFYYFDTFDELKTCLIRQSGQSNVLEAAFSANDQTAVDLSFLYMETNIRNVSYIIEDMGAYKIIVIYINM